MGAASDTTDQAKSYEVLMAKVKDESKRRKLDSSVKEKMQHGGGPMGVGVVGRWSWTRVEDTIKETVSMQ